jgi:hypothetical protein
MKIINHEVNGLQISQRHDDGYINLTQMAKAYGKRIDNWLRLKDTQDLLIEFERQEKLNTSDLRDLNSALIIRRGKYDGGTWGHPDIAIQFAQWLDKSFALQVSRWVREWMTTGKNPVQPQPVSLSDDLLAALDRLERSIVSIRSQARAVHTCAHQPLDELLAKSLHSLSHNQLSAIVEAIHQMQALKELGTLGAELPVIPETRTIGARSIQTVEQKKQLKSVNIKLPVSQRKWLAKAAQTIRDNQSESKRALGRVFPQHLIEVAVELLQHSDVDLDSAYSIFWDLDESIVNVNFQMVREQQEWLTALAQTIRNNCSKPTLPAERVYPQHLIGVAIDLLQSVDRKVS